MFGFKPVKEQRPELRRENTKLRAALEQANADVAYFAMMADIELENNEETEEGSHENEI